MTVAARASDFPLDPEASAHASIIPLALRQRDPNAADDLDPALRWKNWGVFPECYAGTAGDPALQWKEWGVFPESFR